MNGTNWHTFTPPFPIDEQREPWRSLSSPLELWTSTNNHGDPLGHRFCTTSSPNSITANVLANLSILLEHPSSTNTSNGHQNDLDHLELLLWTSQLVSAVNVMIENPPALPRGWRREEFSRPRGLSNGKYQVHYINESGQRFKNKCMLARFVGGEVDLTPFDWRTGKIDPHLKKKVERMIRLRDCPDVNRRLRNDHTIKPPLRQTVSNLKLPVTIYRAQPKEQPPVQPPTNTVMTRQIQNQIKQANNHESQRAALAAAEARTNNFKPRQIFWEKRLQGQHASINDENFEKFSLPRIIKSIIPEHINDDSVVRTLVASLYDRSLTNIVTGQSTPRQEITKNPSIFLDPYQPPTKPINVNDDDLKEQEKRVQHYRRELERIMKSDVPTTSENRQKATNDDEKQE